jgi:hypothetical protein
MWVKGQELSSSDAVGAEKLQKDNLVSFLLPTLYFSSSKTFYILDTFMFNVQNEM